MVKCKSSKVILNDRTNTHDPVNLFTNIWASMSVQCFVHCHNGCGSSNAINIYIYAIGCMSVILLLLPLFCNYAIWSKYSKLSRLTGSCILIWSFNNTNLTVNELHLIEHWQNIDKLNWFWKIFVENFHWFAIIWRNWFYDNPEWIANVPKQRFLWIRTIFCRYCVDRIGFIFFEKQTV